VSHLDLTAARSGGIGHAVDADWLIRSVLFVAAFLVAWISLHPFQSLAEPPQTVAEGGDLANQIGYSVLFLLLLAWAFSHEPRRLLLLLRPALIATLLWTVLSVVASWEPALAARRFVFALMFLSISATVLLLPKNVRHFRDLLAVVAIVVLAISYLGVVLVPDLAIHQATDFLEPEHAGNWRGAFPHKNEAGATMVLLIFIGLFIARAHRALLGGVIVALAAIFLLFTQSKNAIGMLPLVFLLSAIIGRSRPIASIVLVLAVVAALNLLSVGTVLFEPVRKLVMTIMPDATFTGRTEIWELAVQYIARRPITGYGFSAFWGTPQVVYGAGDSTSWVNAASDAHNAYVNLALGIGLPGLVLVLIWVVALPIADFCRLARRSGAPTAPLAMLFLRVCLYGACASCFESSIFTQLGEVWFLYVTSAFGLCYLSRTAAIE
jgi:O-antigen ligase